MSSSSFYFLRPLLCMQRSQEVLSHPPPGYMLMSKHEPMLVGDIMRQLFILREDGTVDLDLLAAHLRAEELHPDKERKLK